MILPASLIADYSATITMPNNNDVGVSYNPTIVIQTLSSTFEPRYFDTTHITVGFPDCDTTIFTVKPEPTILFVEDNYYVNIQDSVKRNYTVTGTYSYTPTSVNFIPSRALKPGTKYHVEIWNLNVIKYNDATGLWDTLNVNGDKITFTTTPLSHYITDFSINENLKCNDTLMLEFNRTLDSVATPTGEIFDISIVDSVNFLNDSTWNFITSEVQTSKWLSDDSTKLYIKLDSIYNIDTRFKYSVNTSKLNGDTTSNFDGFLFYKKGSVFNIKNVIADTNYISNSNSFTYPEGGNFAFGSGSTANVSAYNVDSNYIFNSWHCDELNMHTSQSSLTFSNDCQNIKDLNLKALYFINDTVSVEIENSSSYLCEVYSSNFQYLGGAGTYTLAPNDYLRVTASSESSTISPSLEDWVVTLLKTNSNSTLEDIDSLHFQPGITLQVLDDFINGIIVPNKGGSIRIGPDGSITEEILDIKYRGIAKVRESHQGLGDCSGYDVASVSPYSIVEANSSILYTFSCTIKTEFINIYKIIGYQINGQSRVTITPSDYYSVDATLQKNTRVVTFFVEPTMYDLTVEVNLDVFASTGFNAILGKDYNVNVIVNNGCDREIMNFNIKENSNPITVELPYNSTVFFTLNPCEVDGKKTGIEFNGWDTNYDVPTEYNYKGDRFYLIINEDKHVKADFYEYFRLKEVKVYQEDTDNITDDSDMETYNINYLVNSGITLAGLECRNLLTLIDNGTESQMYFVFNDGVNKSPSNLNGNIYTEDLSDRVDNLLSNGSNVKRRYKYHNILSQINRSQPNELGFKLCDNKTSECKGSQFEYSITSSIINNSVTPVNLHNPFKGKGYTELPGLKLSFEKIYIDHNDYETFISDDHEMYVYYNAYITRVLGVKNSFIVQQNDFNFLIDKTDPSYISLSKGWNNINSVLLDHRDMKLADGIKYFHMMEEDDGGTQTVLDFKTEYNLTYNVGSYPKGFKDGISIEANVSGIILAFATNPVIGAQILYIYESILKEVETASNNDYYGIGIYYSSWRNSWFGAHPKYGKSMIKFKNSQDNGVESQFKVELYKSDDTGNNSKY